ncbi:MAG: type II toxin-antitoxin system VapC family toxin [Candidatus Lokiarchaeota archaeon]|nr:type II toxin-antitoxin system VapC family toxin [Candidatus Lokiarchaeota archaeon]
MIILDTNACIEYLNGKESIKDILSKQDDLIHITAITVYEVNIGLERTKRKISEKRYKFLHKIWREFTDGMQIFQLGLKEAEKAAQLFDKLEAKGLKLDDNDILIAGIMLANGIKKIITKNVTHFNRIEELEIIEY